MIQLLTGDSLEELETIFSNELDADLPEQYDAVLADIEDGELKCFITSEAMLRIGMLWLSPRLRNTFAGAKKVSDIFRYVDRNAPKGSSIIVIADEPQFADICEKFGMRKVEGTVYRIDK